MLHGAHAWFYRLLFFCWQESSLRDLASVLEVFENGVSGAGCLKGLDN